MTSTRAVAEWWLKWWHITDLLFYLWTVEQQQQPSKNLCLHLQQRKRYNLKRQTAAHVLPLQQMEASGILVRVGKGDVF